MKGIIAVARRRGQGPPAGEWAARSAPPSRLGLTALDWVVVVIVVTVFALFGVWEVSRARVEVREELALEHLRDVANASILYQQATHAYPANLRELGLPTSDPPYLPLDLAQEAANIQGYRLTYERKGPEGFILRADPVQPGISGVRHFIIDHTRTIHMTRDNRDATLTDPVQ